MSLFNTESDDPAREDIHDDHHPKALQQYGLASEEVDAPQAVTGFSNDRQPRRTFASRLWRRVARKNPTHHVLVDLQAEGVRDLLGDARATKVRIEALELENRSYQFL